MGVEPKPRVFLTLTESIGVPAIKLGTVGNRIDAIFSTCFAVLCVADNVPVYPQRHARVRAPQLSFCRPRSELHPLRERVRGSCERVGTHESRTAVFSMRSRVRHKCLPHHVLCDAKKLPRLFRKRKPRRSPRNSCTNTDSGSGSGRVASLPTVLGVCSFPLHTVLLNMDLPSLELEVLGL